MTTSIATQKTVTDEQIGKAHKMLCDTGNYYLVENSRGDIGQDGYLIEYKVQALRTPAGTYRVVCNCKAGQAGLPSCWHRRAAMAAEAEYQQAMREQAIAQVPAFYGEVNGKPVTKEEYDRLMNRKAKPATVKSTLHYPAFSILRTA